MFNLKSTLLSIIFLSYLGLTSALYATEYQVELIVFEHLNSNASLEGEPRIDTQSHYPTLRNFNTVTRENLLLTEQATKIRGSRNFRLLKHFAWSQEGLSKKEAGSLDLARWIPGVQGRLTLYLGRYLHLEVSMQKQSEDGLSKHVMRERRRMRSNEIHYLDHPYFGIIAKITPVITENIEAETLNN